MSPHFKIFFYIAKKKSKESYKPININILNQFTGLRLKKSALALSFPGIDPSNTDQTGSDTDVPEFQRPQTKPVKQSPKEKFLQPQQYPIFMVNTRYTRVTLSNPILSSNTHHTRVDKVISYPKGWIPATHGWHCPILSKGLIPATHRWHCPIPSSGKIPATHGWHYHILSSEQIPLHTLDQGKPITRLVAAAFDSWRGMIRKSHCLCKIGNFGDCV